MMTIEQQNEAILALYSSMWHLVMAAEDIEKKRQAGNLKEHDDDGSGYLDEIKKIASLLESIRNPSNTSSQP